MSTTARRSNLLELHSLWLTQDTELPQRNIWNPRLCSVYSLLFAGGVAQLKNLHRHAAISTSANSRISLSRVSDQMQRVVADGARD